MTQETTAHVAERVACNEYRESGIEWIGKIPRHWHVMRARFCMVVNPVSRGLRDLQPDDEVSFVPMEAVGRGRLDLKRTRTVAARRVGYTEFQDGDVIVAKITPCFENGKGAVARELLNGVGIGTTELHVLRAGPSLDHRFLFYFTISQPFRSMGEGEMYGAGGQKRVPVEFCKDIRIPQPPSVNEQRAIADFLDQKTTKIDVLTERKRTLIERLKEKRAALISRTVTRGLPPEAARAAGLDPHPRLKPTGVDWLGDVPAHWNVVPLIRIVDTIQTGPFGSQLHSEDYVAGGVPLINPAHMIAGRLLPDKKSTVDEVTALRLKRHELRVGDIVMARRGEIGRCCVVGPDEAGWLCGTGSMLLRLRECDASYFSMLFGGAGFSQSLALHAVGTTMANLNPMIVGRMLVPVPPLSEQMAMKAYLTKEAGQLAALEAKIESVIERLQEYRIALVGAVITGKIDVNGTDSCPGGLTPAEERQARSADFMRLWGAWPGDEPIEELLAQLRSSRRHAPDVSLNREIVDTDQ